MPINNLKIISRKCHYKYLEKTSVFYEYFYTEDYSYFVLYPFSLVLPLVIFLFDLKSVSINTILSSLIYVRHRITFTLLYLISIFIRYQNKIYLISCSSFLHDPCISSYLAVRTLYLLNIIYTSIFFFTKLNQPRSSLFFLSKTKCSCYSTSHYISYYCIPVS